MRFSEYLEVGKKMKTARTNAGISQRDMGNTTYSKQNNQLMAHLSWNIKNAQIATFIPDSNKVNVELAFGLMDEYEYQKWLEDTLKLFNVPIDDYIYHK